MSRTDEVVLRSSCSYCAKSLLMQWGMRRMTVRSRGYQSQLPGSSRRLTPFAVPEMSATAQPTELRHSLKLQSRTSLRQHLIVRDCWHCRPGPCQGQVVGHLLSPRRQLKTDQGHLSLYIDCIVREPDPRPVKDVSKSGYGD